MTKLAGTDRYPDRWQVIGSSGTPYVVSKDLSGCWACSCIGWTRHLPRKDCKHIRTVKSFMGLPAFAPAKREPMVVRQPFRRPATPKPVPIVPPTNDGSVEFEGMRIRKFRWDEE